MCLYQWNGNGLIEGLKRNKRVWVYEYKNGWIDIRMDV